MERCNEENDRFLMLIRDYSTITIKKSKGEDDS
jgi:hypothetical protein